MFSDNETQCKEEKEDDKGHILALLQELTVHILTQQWAQAHTDTHSSDQKTNVVPTGHLRIQGRRGPPKVEGPDAHWG